MNWEYLHLISHSFPIVLSATGAAVGIAGWIADREGLEKWGLVAFLVGGAFVVPAYVTGLAAADVVADRTFVRPSAIQRHRTWATVAAVPLVVAAILAGFSFAEPEDRRLRRFVILVGAVAAAVTGFAATLGARIEHGPEAREPIVHDDLRTDRRTASHASLSTLFAIDSSAASPDSRRDSTPALPARPPAAGAGGR